MANDLGNQYAFHALRERRAEMAGEITSLESRLRRLRDSLVHIDGTLRIMAPGFNPKTIPKKRSYKRVKLFGLWAGKAQWADLGRHTAWRTAHDDAGDRRCDRGRAWVRAGRGEGDQRTGAVEPALSE